jgi:TPR repeat protein
LSNVGEPRAVQRQEGERGIAQPAVAVIPIAFVPLRRIYTLKFKAGLAIGSQAPNAKSAPTCRGLAATRLGYAISNHDRPDQGDAQAQYNLGVFYDDGLGVPQNYGEAVKWYRKAADQGEDRAQNNLATMYANGQGVAQNYGEAVKWFRKAADEGNALSQYSLGLLFRSGTGVPQNNGEAVKWYRRAADQGYGDAQFNLGSMYANGLGVPQDYVRAHMWFNLAAAAGDKDGAKNSYPRLALRSAVTWTFIMADVPTRALTAPRPIKPTSSRCHSAWQPNPGRGSTYRRGKSV